MEVKWVYLVLLRLYDAVGNLRVSVDGRGWPTSTSYDALDRPLAMAYANGQRLTYAYDAVGQITTMLDWTGPTLSSYDGAGQLSSVSTPLGGVPMTVTYGYWPDGRRAAMYYPDAWGSAPEGLGYAYTPNGWLGQMYPTQTSGGWLYPGCDDLGRLTFFSTSITGLGNTRNTFYDAAGQVTSAQVFDSNPTAPAPLVRFTATYDPAGNKLSQLELDGSVVSFTYDASYQLLSEVRSGTSPYAITYAYDALGNRLSQNVDGQLTTYSYGAANQLLAQVNPDASLTTYAYDANGNRNNEVSAAGVTSYTWDGANRLLSVQEPSGTTSYTYGGDGLRRSTSDASGTKLFLWDGQNLLLEKDASLNTTALYLGVPDTYQSLLLMRQGNDWFFLAFDTQGSVRTLIAAGDVISDSYTLSAYGVMLALLGSTPNPMRFLGGLGYYSEDDNRAYVRARIVEMITGRFLSRDPIAFGGRDWNLYRYAGNNPASQADPYGLQSTTPTPYPAPTPPSNTPTPQPSCGVCGPEIGNLLWYILFASRQYFKGLNGKQKFVACNDLNTFPMSSESWDIPPLHSDNYDSYIGSQYPGCATGICGQTVSIYGQCYKSADVNYIAYGIFFSLCYRWAGGSRNPVNRWGGENMTKDVWGWKLLAHHNAVNGDRASRWAVLGYG